MLTDQNIGNGIIFGFINALPGPCFNETSNTVHLVGQYKKNVCQMFADSIR